MSAATDFAKTGLNVFLGLAKKAVIAAAVTALPLLGVPVINFVFTWLVGWVFKQLQPLLEVWLVDTIIDVQVQAEKNAYERAREELRAVLQAHIRNPRELENASQDFDRRLADLIRFNP